LCGDCRHSRRVDSNKGATYWLCGRSATDSRYPKYPRLPLRHCTGYEPAVTPASLLDSEEWGLLQRGVTSMNPTPAASITIRQATIDDVPLILSFIRGLADYEKLLDAVKATEEMLRETLFGARPAAEVLIAEDGGTPVGFALFFENYSTFLAQRGIYLEDLFVIPEARGRGVGRVLLQRLSALALERGCGRLEWAVLDWNAPAIGFYKRMGAVPMDDWTVNRLTGPALEKMARGESR
jgi:GNAT superfamily N-acetyltransferase